MARRTFRPSQVALCVLLQLPPPSTYRRILAFTFLLSISPRNVAHNRHLPSRIRYGTHILDRKVRAAAFREFPHPGDGATIFLHTRLVFRSSLQAWEVHQRIFNAAAVARQRQLKASILARKTELLQTSAQDQFAKWAKLRRSVDKGLADLEKLSTCGIIFCQS